MKYSIFFLFILCLCVGFTTNAQKLNPDTSIAVKVNGNLIDNPWAGGFNAPHFSEIDLNQDGIMDLFAFDRDGDRITTYINEGKAGQVSYTYAPNYRDKFPDMHDWTLLEDFNCDGKKDIFTYTYKGGMALYKNVSNSTDGLIFEEEVDLIRSYYGSNLVNLYVSPVNQPVLIDVDGDTDLDIITFSISGSILEYHKNYAIDSLGRCDTLKFHLVPGCWGKFGLSPFSNSAELGILCRVSPFTFNNPDPQNQSLHSGSCMLGLDIDNDNDIDLINGDLLGNNLLLLVNGGDNQNANITSQDSLFPVYDIPVDLATFPAAYFIDLNNDNAKDLIIAPCTGGSSENFENILYYKNTATTQAPVFQFTNGTFLVEDMIEVGAGSNVELFDVNKDGLMDMLIGNYGYYNPTPPYVSGISYYQNIGTASEPEFDLITRDFSNLNSFNLNGIHPCFGDADGDGDDDMIIGDADGKLHYFRNTAGAGNPVSFTLTGPNYQGIDVGQFSAPYLFDINGDSKLDLIVGEREGNLNYYENTGTTSSPTFTLVSDSLGAVDVSLWWDNEGYSDPVLYYNGANIEMLVGSKRGTVHSFDNITGNLSGSFALIDSVYSDIDERERASIARYDIDNDGIEDLLVGNYSGGVIFYSSTSTVGIDNPDKINDFTLYPNPANDLINIQLNTNSASKDNEVSIYSVTGQLIYSSIFNSYKTQIQTLNWPSGFYIIKVETDNNLPMVQKLIVR